jgi:arylsulfatase A-like enzyme
MTAAQRVGLALLAAAVASCSAERAPYTTSTTAVLIADTLPSLVIPGVLRGEDVTIGRQRRRVLAAPESGKVQASLQQMAGARHYRVDALPPDIRSWGQVMLVREAEVGRQRLPQWPMIFDLARQPTPIIGVSPFETVGPSTTLTAYAAPVPEAFDVETLPFAVPENATLAFALGVLAPSRRVPAAVEARVLVREGHRVVEIWRATPSGTQETWSEERVSLAAFAGRTIRLRFESRKLAAGLAQLLAVFGEPVVLVSHRTATRPLNVVLISMDTLRAQSVGVYGAERPTTPTLDALAAEGVVFENAFSTAAFTLPGHLSMFTGLWLRTHGSLSPLMPLAPERRTLPELLRSAGWATGAFTSTAWIMPGLGFRRGVDLYDEHDPPLGKPPPVGRPCDAFTNALAWMRDRRDQPFFAFLHNYQVHMPYEAPPPYFSLYDAVPEGPVVGEYRRYRYEQEVRYGDDQLRALLEGIDALGIADRTLIIVTSDHGEGFGEHGLNDHTREVYDEIARVPLVMRLPGALPAGRHVAEPVSLADLLPTILDITGLPPLADADGSSLLPLATGAVTRLPREGVITEAQSAGFVGWVDLTAVRTRTHTCMFRASEGRTLCFDRRVDPWERSDALPETDTSAEVRAARSFLDGLVVGKPPLVSLWSPEDADAARAAPEGPLTPERRNLLRALGYLD